MQVVSLPPDQSSSAAGMGAISPVPMTVNLPDVRGRQVPSLPASQVVVPDFAGDAERAVRIEVESFVEAPGIFNGLRVALLFNAFLGLAGLLAYEAWTGFFR